MKYFSYKEIIKIVKKNKFEKIFTFGQSRGGTTITSYILAHELGFLSYFVPEEISNKLNVKRMFIELIKNKKIFIHNHHNVFKRKLLNNKKTIFIYIYRNDREILQSFKKIYTRNSDFDFLKDIHNRVLKKKKLKIKNGPKYLNDLWKKQINYFHHAYTLDFNSIKKHKFYINKKIRNKKFISIKQISINKTSTNKNKKNNDNFKLSKYHSEKGLKYIKLIILFLYYKCISILT